MRKLNLILIICPCLIIANCTQTNENSETLDTPAPITEKEAEISKVLSKTEVKELDLSDQKKYLSDHHGLDFETLSKMSENQFTELLELHLNGIFDNTSLNEAWKEFANLDNEESMIYIDEHFNGVENMEIILSIYGPMFYNK